MLLHLSNSLAGTPPKQTWPRSGLKIPEMMLSSVLLPQPDGPRIAKMECAGMARLIFSSAVSAPPSAESNDLLMPASVIAIPGSPSQTLAGGAAAGKVSVEITLTRGLAANCEPRTHLRPRGSCESSRSSIFSFGLAHVRCCRSHALPARDIVMLHGKQIEYASDGMVDDVVD